MEGSRSWDPTFFHHIIVTFGVAFWHPRQTAAIVSRAVTANTTVRATVGDHPMQPLHSLLQTHLTLHDLVKPEVHLDRILLRSVLHLLVV